MYTMPKYKHRNTGVLTKDDVLCCIKSETLGNNKHINKTILEKHLHYVPKSLKNITYLFIKQLIRHDKNILISNGCKNNNLYIRTENFLEQTEDVEQSHMESKKKVDSKECNLELNQPQSLFKMCYEKVILLICENKNIEESIIYSININCVNTVPEEKFLIFNNHSLYSADDDYMINVTDESNIQSEYLIKNYSHKEIFSQAYSCKFKQKLREVTLNFNQIIDDSNLEQGKGHNFEHENTNILYEIKTEPMESINLNIDEPFIKTEIDENFEETNNILQIENTHLNLENTFDSEAIMFEKPVNFFTEHNFAKFEKIDYEKQTMFANNNHNQVVFSQSSLRVRKQFAPDSDNETDNTMSLLIPQTYKSLPTETTQNMITRNNNMKKLFSIQKSKPNKKKYKQKIREKTLSTKEKSIEEQELVLIKDINELTENKTTNEKERVQSSDSDSINMPLKKRIKKIKKCKRYLKKQCLIIPEHDIQCNNVDSTQNVSENNESFYHDDKTDCFDVNSKVLVEYNDLHSEVKSSTNISGLKNQLSSETEKLQLNKQAEDSNRSFSFENNLEGVVERLHYEPYITKIAYDIKDGKYTPTNKLNLDLIKSGENETCVKENKADNSVTILNNLKWQCHSINNNDSKLIQKPIIILEKLPEMFVKSYLQLQDAIKKHKEIVKVKRLSRFLPQFSNKTLLPHNNENIKCETIGSCITTNANLQQDSKIRLSGYHYLNNDDEFVDFNKAPNMPILESSVVTCAFSKEQSDHGMSLINEEMDLESVDKFNHNTQFKSNKHLKTGNKRAEVSTLSKNLKSTTKKPNDDNLLMLTADKVMDKDLRLFNESVLVHHVYNEDTTYKSVKKDYPKRIAQCTTKTDTTSLENNSSEEEKQLVNIKAKLLKKIMKKQEDTRLDDAKQAKLVSEFIEKCEAPGPRKKCDRGCSVRTQKNINERQKQLYVLSKELFGESSEQSLLGKKGFRSFGKGRRNIRKVIDKKSLARSTVVANMEENERKRRLHQRQIAMIESLGCENNVNVVVINDELCLEYDVELNMPIASIHNFFTSVMKEHQYEGVKFMWDACFESLAKIETGHAGGGCILAHCMGLGKTLQVLALLHTVLTHPRIDMQRVLVCCPLSTVLNWVDEIHKWIKPVTNQIKVFELSKLKKTHERAYQLEDWYKGGGIFIIGYELFRNLTTLDPIIDKIRPSIVDKIRKALLDPGPNIIICDEGHLLKNDNSVLAMAISRVATKRRIVLTGTPMQNNLREYYCMVDFVKPNLLGRYSEFSNRFENPIINGQHRDSKREDIKLMKARIHILHKVLEGVLQRQEASVLYSYLPKKHEYTVFIPLSKCQCDLYKHYLTHYTHDKHNTIKDFHILQKIWTHPQVLHNFYLKSRDENINKVSVEKLEDDFATDNLTGNEGTKPSQTEKWWLQYLEEGSLLNTLESSNKFLIVFRILEECIAFDDKVLIFSTSLFTMDTLEYFLKKINNWSLGREYYRVDGSVPVEVRQKWCQDFNADINKTTKLFLISTRTGSLGLNMTAANRVIIFDTSWNPAHDTQSIFRVYRFGQKKDCYIYRLVALGTMEQKIYERSVTKQAISCRVIDEQQIDRHYNMDELAELYKFDETGAGVACGVAVGVTDVALLRVARDTPLYAVHEHDSLLRGSVEQQLPEDECAAAWRQFEQEQEGKQLENLGNSLQKTPTKRPYEHDDPKPPNLTIDATNEKEYISGAKNNFKLKKINNNFKLKKKELNDSSTCVEKEPVKIVEHTDQGTEETITIKAINNNSKQEDVAEHTEVIIENMIKKMRNIIEARLKNSQHTTAIDHDTLTNNFKNMAIQSTSKDIASSVVHATNEDHKAPHKSLDTCSKPEINNKINKPNTNVNKMVLETRNNKRKICYNDTEKLSYAEIDDSAVTVTEKKTAVICLDLKNLSSDEDDVLCMEDDNSILVQKLDKQHKNDSQTECDNNKVILLSDTETITDNEEENEKLTPIPDKKHSEGENKNINCILLSDEDDEVNTNTNRSELKIIDITETSDNDEKICLPKSLLINEKFIKIVAHSYLELNASLNLTEALLAARYSTQKAFKENSKTGKELCSGDLYDIAIKKIGIETLKKIQSNNNDKPKVTNAEIDKTKHSKKMAQSKDLDNSHQTNIDLTSDDETLTKPHKSEETTMKKSTPRKRVRERLCSSSSDDLILMSDQPKTPERNKIVNKPLSTNSNNTKDQLSASKPSLVEILSEAPPTSGNAVHIKMSTSRDLRVSDNNKRPSTSTGVGEVKRSYSCKLNLKDFHIDDIDDIIELE